MKRRVSRTAAACSIVCVAVAPFAVACASDGELDTGSVEEALEHDFLTAPGITVGRASCPARVEASTGSSFECLLDVDGQELQVEVTVESAEGDVTFEQRQEVVVTAELHQQVASQLADELGAEVTVHCDDRAALVLEQGALLTCSVSDPAGSTISVEAEIGPEGIIVVKPLP
jgi:hypothetical protein